jgi:hypothetical protein
MAPVVTNARTEALTARVGVKVMRADLSAVATNAELSRTHSDMPSVTAEQRRRLIPPLGMLAVTLCLALRVSLGAASDTVTPTPTTASKGSTQPVRFSLDRTVNDTEAGLKEAKHVVVGGREMSIVGAPTAQSVTVTLDLSDLAGTLPVRVVDKDNKELATGALSVIGPDPHVSLLALYVVLIVGFPLILMWLDTQKAYTFAKETRNMLLAKFATGQVSPEELKTFVADLDACPPGIPGFARAVFALTLLALIGVILLHFIAGSDHYGGDIPEKVEKILTQLVTALASVTAFYFGTRAVEKTTETTRGRPAGSTTRGSASGTPQKPLVVAMPTSGKQNDGVMLRGPEFGQSMGSVKFGQTNAKVTKWTDTEIVVEVPPISAGLTTIIVTPAIGAQSPQFCYFTVV